MPNPNEDTVTTVATPPAATETVTTPADDGAPQSAEDAVLDALGAPREGELEGDAAAATDGTQVAGQQRDANERFTKPGEQTPAAATPEPGVKPDAVAADAARKPAADDPDALPEGLSEKAQQRFQSLSKERNEWRDRANQWQQTIASTGADPQQFGQMLEYERLVNSGKPEDLRSALAMAKDAVRELSTVLGEDTQAIDVFSPYPDIAKRVSEGDIDRKTAVELVRSRQQATALQQQQLAAAQSGAEQQAITTATAQLDQLGQQLRARDPDFERKFAAIKGVIPIIAENQPPAQWAAAFLRAYQGLNLPPVVAAPSRLPASPQPLHGGRSGQAGLRMEPKSAEEAVAAALGL
jgi:hypothetical protein